MARVVLLEQRVVELEAAVEQQSKKKQRSHAQLQHGGVLQVQEAQEMIISREQANQEADFRFNQQNKKRAPPTCSNCGGKGHNLTRCKILRNVE